MTTQEDKNDTNVDLPESVITMLKSIASSLAETLTEVKERLFTLEVEMRTLASRVDHLEQQIAEREADVKHSSQSSKSESVFKTAVMSIPTSQSVSSSLSTSPSPSTSLRDVTRTKLQDTAGVSKPSISQGATISPQSQITSPSQSPRSLTTEQKTSSPSFARTSEDDKKKEKEELLKALKLIDML